MKNFSGLLLLLLAYGLVQAQQSLKLFPSIHSIGYQIGFPASFDADSNAYCTVRYKKQGGVFESGFPASQINNFGKREFRGSLFLLEAATKYIVEITVTDSFPVFQTFKLSDSTYTRTDVQNTGLSNFKYVSPGGTGSLYTAAAPGNLKTLLASGVTCGTTIILKGGVYSTGDMQLNLINGCSENTPIIIRAAENEVPVIDGGDYTQYTWTKSTNDTNLYYTTIKPELEYNSLCLMDGLRLYPYAFLNPPAIDPAYPSLTSLGYELSGFYRNANQVYLKTIDHKNPNQSNIIFSKYFYCLQVQGNKNQNYIYFKGITFKNYGKGTCTKDIFGNPTCYPSFTLAFENASHVIVDSCKFEFCNVPISFGRASNYNSIQHCTIIDGIGTWSHGAFKQTREAIILERGSYGRYLEYSGINFYTDDSIAKGNIIRNNTVSGTVGGLVGQRSSANGGTEETDIYNNKVSYCYNGINSDGGSMNTRIWNNEVDHCSVGLSFIAAISGPNYIFRNNIHHIIERKNHHKDIFFLDCNNVLSEKIWGTGVKLNASSKTSNPPDMFFVNNTFHSIDSIAFSMYLWHSTWKRLYSRNNIYYSEGHSSFFFDGPKNDSSYSFNSSNDCFFNKLNGKVASIQPTNGIPVCSTYTTGNALGADLKSISTGKDVWVVNDFNIDPGFQQTGIDFRLKNASPLVDKGILIQGFHHNFNGSAPDIGAFESDTFKVIGVQSQAAVNSDSWLLYPNPANAVLHIKYPYERIPKPNENEYEIFDLRGQKLTEGYLDGNETTISVTLLSHGIYFLRIGEVMLKFVK